MKNLLTIMLLAIFAIVQLPCRAQSDSLNELYRRTAALSDSIQQLNDSIAAQKINAAVQQYYDSSAVAAAMSDPLGTIYKDEWKYKGHVWEVPPFWMVLIVLAVVICSFYAVLKTNMLRDGARDASGELLPISERPFSYSRTQLFWWTMIILSCFVLFFLKTWCLLPLNVSCVVLLGLGALVHVGGRIIDQRDLDNVDIDMGTRKQDVKSGKASFFKDLLTDGSGVCIHRFQSLVFNLLFGLGFVVYFAIRTYARQYPFMDFSQWQLALLGVSSATYLSIKATENTTQAARNIRAQRRVQQPASRQADTTVVNTPTTPQATPQEEPSKRNPADFEQ